MSCKIGDVMNRNPKVFLDEQAALKEAEKKPLVAYPIVTKEGILRKIIFGDRKDETESKVLENVPLVMMAGGKGTRLYPYTKVLPERSYQLEILQSVKGLSIIFQSMDVKKYGLY